MTEKNININLFIYLIVSLVFAYIVHARGDDYERYVTISTMILWGVGIVLMALRQLARSKRMKGRWHDGE